MRTVLQIGCKYHWKVFALMVFLTHVLVNNSNAQTIIAQQDFETTPATPIWSYTNTGGAVSTATGAGDTPANQRIRNGSRSFLLNNGTATLDFGNVTVSGYTNTKITVRISSTSATTANGADAADHIRLFTALNGGAFLTNTQENANIAVNGNSNARWGYNTTGVTTTAGTNVIVTATGGTNAGTVYSTLVVNIPDGNTSVALRIIAFNNNDDEFWNIDDVIIEGSLSASGASTLTAGALTEPTTISSIANTSNTAVQNFDFTLTDDGATPATDATTTRISQITFNQGAGNDVADWTQAIAGAELTDGTSTLIGTITATSITFASLANTNPSDFGYITDNSNKTYTLKIWLKTNVGNTIQQIIEGLNLVFEVTTSSITLEAGSSTFLAGETESSGATNNSISVVATKYLFRTVPSNVATSNNFTVVVDATDANNNRDIDNISAVTLVKNTGTGNLTVTSPQNLAAGTRSFTDCQLDAADTYTLNASGTFTTITSSNITATVAVTGDYRSRNTTGTWNTATDWERFDGTNWVTATTAPSSTDGTITILSGHTITVNTNITIDQVVIASGGTLVRGANALITLNNGTGNEITIFGTFKIETSTLTGDDYGDAIVYSGGKILVKTDGIFEVSISAGSGHSLYATEPITTVEFENNAVFLWNPASASSFTATGITYFPSVASNTIPIFRVNQTLSLTAGGSPTIINGRFDVTSGNIVTWNQNATRTFRNGLGGLGTITQGGTSGIFIINGDASELSISNLNLDPSLGLQINHAGTTTLNSNVSVSGGKITLTAGDIDLNGFNIDLGTTGSIAENLTLQHTIKDNTATTEANPGGYVRATKRAVTSTGVNIAGLGLLLGDATSYDVNIDRYHYRAGIGQAIKRIYKITGTPTATTLRINYAEDELAGINESELGMFRWRSSTGWFNYTTGETKDATANFAEVTDIAAFSHWTLGSELTPLPVRLISFKADINKEGNSFLTWTTASEQNNTGFEIQKSANGVDFSQIGFVDGNGNSNQIRNYQFEDKAFTNSSYYRLKQIDADGKFSISNLVYVEKETSKFFVYPNPIDDKALYFNVTDESIETKLINAQGKTLWQYKGNVGDTERALHQFIKQSPQGMYLIQINTDKGILQTKIVR